jgi:hypothetical protein
MINPFEALKNAIALVDKVRNRDLYEKLVQLMESVQTLTEENIALKKKLRQIEDEAVSDSELEFRSPLFYAKGDPQPFCPTCWQGPHKRVRLAGPRPWSGQQRYDCSVCKETFFVGDDPGPVGYRRRSFRTR